MKIIFISDIHSNWHYLSQVKEFIQEERADLIYFCGDAIGYYDNPNEVLRWLEHIKAICIKGNHEKYFLNEIEYENNLENIYLTQYNKNIISNENFNFVKSWSDILDFTIDNKRFLIVHGDSNSSENHIYDIKNIDKEILTKYDYYIYGHTHIPLIQYHYGCCIINPGSMGQPRDYTGLPSYVVLNLETNEISIKKIKVESDSYISYLEDKSYNGKVINILKKKKNEHN